MVSFRPRSCKAMQAFNFDLPPDRRGTDSIKWGKYAQSGVIPMWVADMDFAAPEVVIDAIQQRVEHGVFGYAHPSEALNTAVVEGIRRDHGWNIEPEWLVWLPGVVPGFNVACKLAGEPSDSVLTFPPIYPPFLYAPEHSDRRLIRSYLSNSDQRWEIDWDSIKTVGDHSTRLLMLCNPHNPVGRVWSRKDLVRLAQFAEHNDWLICSDDIHCGLVIDPAQRYIPIATLDETVAQRTITLMAPSKTWNIPGLSCAFAVIPNASLRQQYIQAGRGFISDVNILGLVAAEAAYRDGDPWRQALLKYLHGNALHLHEAINELPGLSMQPVEATYLAWIDCHGLGVPNPQKFFEKHGVGCSDGRDFGLEGFIRLNFGCSRALLDEALARIKAAIESPNL